MKQLAGIWDFIAGDSRRAPAAVAVAVTVAAVLLRSSFSSAVVAVVFAAIIALGLSAAVFENR